MTDVYISIPARPELISILRSVVAGVAATLDFTVDAIDDLRLAVDEVCSHLIGPPAEDDARVTLRIHSDPDCIELEAISSAPRDEWPPQGFEHHLSWQILQGLCDSVSFEGTIGAPSIRITKRLAR